MGGARIELVRAGDETRLGICYQQIPVRLMPPFVLDGEPASLLYLINLTAGLMDGDGHLHRDHGAGGHAAVVTGQSATRIHPALDELRHPAVDRRRSRTTPAWSSCPARRSRSAAAATISAGASSSRRAPG